MTATPRASVIVRSKDAASTIESTLQSLRSQTVPVEIVVVDSGSTDGTLDVARQYADRLVQIEPADFSFGGALNLGADSAAAEFHFALSSHSVPETEEWIERSLAHYENPEVAATSTMLWLPSRLPMRDVLYQDLAHARKYPQWGFSNTGSSWRAELWRRHRFSETIEACEDKEWAWRVMSDGYTVAIDPRLWVSQGHRKRSGVRALLNRTRKEFRSMGSYTEIPTYDLRSAVGEWWNGIPNEAEYPAAFYRLNYLRAAEIFGRYLGLRDARRYADAPPIGG